MVVLRMMSVVTTLTNVCLLYTSHPKRMHGSILQVGYVGINSQNQLGEQREKQCQRKYENVGYA